MRYVYACMVALKSLCQTLWHVRIWGIGVLFMEVCLGKRHGYIDMNGFFEQLAADTRRQAARRFVAATCTFCGNHSNDVRCPGCGARRKERLIETGNKSH